MYDLIVFLPLLGAAIAGLFGRQIGHRNSEYVTTTLLSVSCALAWIGFFRVGLGHGEEVKLFTIPVANWFTVGELQVDWSLRIDTLTSVMLIVVTTVSTIVHSYSFGYMHDDPHRSRFFSYLSLFTFAMLMLVTSDNLVQMFFGWEGVGLASYLLIGFWYQRPTANAAAIKAFVVNRVGDFGFSLGIFLVFALTHSVSFEAVFAAMPGLVGHTVHAFGLDADAITLACLLLFMGAMGKSAQFLLHTWLPDAMEGPTPVSALIHAATMVTAGVFMVARLSPLFELSPAAQTFVIVIGGTTCFFAATIGLVQNDIKRVIAYSTCSQLGYMFVALGCGGYAVGIFHLFTHAFFKALLFLGAGSVIHAVGGEQDMRKMGGLRTKIPYTFWFMVIGSLALVGFPFTAGYYSKDAIIEVAYASGRGGAAYGWLTTTIAAGLTSFYSFRLLFMTFYGESRAVAPHEETNHNTHAEPAGSHASAGMSPEHEEAKVAADTPHADSAAALGMHHRDHAAADDSHGDAAHAHADHGHGAHGHGGEPHESPPIMLVPLVPLAFGALFAGILFHHLFIGGGMESFWGESLFYAPTNHVIEARENDPWFVGQLPLLMLIVGFVVAYYLYISRPGMAERWADANRPLYKFLLNKWYFDELYDVLFVRPAFWLGRLFWHGGDENIINRFGPDGVASSVLVTTDRVVKFQSGYVYHYAFVMMMGLALIITYFLVGGFR
ncbi:NADH-quinone oxidoreductase subunit L [Lichenibacterium dinghuense]|uniref:NADH-quinone oxidoreductase subunit L n=1 Tax=Lichenibacterium dinghuense TaxID=2895977 RepID=UPI001F030BE9|nr:NADH-quinone oxidoreductase subunit L [Lichenibacterium sp. 6Y81]